MEIIILRVDLSRFTVKQKNNSNLTSYQASLNFKFLFPRDQGVSEEELLRQQQELFARAREQQAQVSFHSFFFF